MKEPYNRWWWWALCCLTTICLMMTSLVIVVSLKGTYDISINFNMDDNTLEAVKIIDQGNTPSLEDEILERNATISTVICNGGICNNEPYLIRELPNKAPFAIRGERDGRR